MRPSAVVLVLGALVGAAACVGLGFWQWGRWRERAEVQRQLQRALAQPPQRYSGSLPDSAAVVGRRIALAGRYDETRQFLLRGRSFEGESGVEVVTPLVLRSGDAVLVNRGWLEAPDGATARPQDHRVPGEREVVGYVEALHRGRAGYPYIRLPGDSVALISAAYLDPDSVAARLPYRVAGFWLRESPGPGTGGLPRRSPPPAPNPGMHLGYAIQWWAIALVIVAGTGWLLAKPAGGRADRPSARSTG